jgi:hypothetical protein
MDWPGAGQRLLNAASIHQIINPLHGLALALLVASVGADHTDDAFAFDDLTVFAKLLN